MGVFHTIRLFRAVALLQLVGALTFAAKDATASAPWPPLHTNLVSSEVACRAPKGRAFIKLPTNQNFQVTKGLFERFNRRPNNVSSKLRGMLSQHKAPLSTCFGIKLNPSDRRCVVSLQAPTSIKIVPGASRGVPLGVSSSCGSKPVLRVMRPPRQGTVSLAGNVLRFTSASKGGLGTEQIAIRACDPKSRCSETRAISISRCTVSARPLNLAISENKTTSFELKADSTCGAAVSFQLFSEPKIGSVLLEGERTARYTVGFRTGQDEFLVRGCDVTGAGCSSPQPIRITIGAGPSFQGNAESLRPYREYISSEERQYLARKLANNRFDLVEGDGAFLGLQDLLRTKFLNADVTAPDLKPALQQVQSRGLKYGRPDPSEEFIPGWQDDFLPTTTCIASLTQSPQGPNCFQPIIPLNRNLNNPADLKFAIERWKLTTERSWHQFNFFYHWGYHRTSSRYLKDARYLSPVAANMWKFWSGHFGTNTQIVNGFQENLVGYYIKTIEREVFGNFRSMILGVPGVSDNNGCAPLTPWTPQHGSILCDAASNMWLSNDKNLGMNQDFARELMELYLLSPNDEFTNSKNYNDTEDIVSAARYVSGIQVTQAKPAMAPGGSIRFAASYDKGRHDTTPGSIFGELAYLNPSLPIANATLTPGALVRHLFNHHPSLPRFIAGKLFSTFVYPDPPTPLVAELGAEFRRLNYNLAAFLQLILGSEAMFSPRAALGRNCISSPLEVYSKILNSVRFPLLPYTDSPAAEEALGIHIDANVAPSGENILGYPTVFGYDYCGRAPGVDGSTAWLFSHLMVFKINDFIKLLNGMTTVLKDQYDLSEALGVIRASPEFADGSAQSVINYFAKRFDLDLSPAERSILLEFMNNRRQGNSLVAAPWNPNDTTPQGRLLIREKLAGLMTILAGFEQSSTH